MKERKNIDRLFQEQLKDFEATPDKEVWKNIEAALKENKKQRKIIPLWFKYTGIAAAFLLGYFALNSLFEKNTENTNTIVLDTPIIKNSKETGISNTNEPEKTENATFKKTKKQPLVVNQNRNKDENEITAVEPTKTSKDKKNNQDNPKIYQSKNNTPIVQPNSNKDNTKQQLVDTQQKQELKQNSIEILKKTKAKPSIVNQKEAIAEKSTSKEKTSLNEAQNPLEVYLKNKESEKEQLAAKPKTKWEIAPNIAAVYLNSSAKGSSIDPTFSDNKKTNENSYSYGIGVNYAVSNKIVLRSGINKVTLGYNTDDVMYSTSLENNSIASIENSSQNNLELKNDKAVNSLASFEKNIQKTNLGALNQTMGYYEVPIEIAYSILDKKINISLIGGISTLFLDENKITLISENTNTSLGQANNLNQIHFSTNLGLGFKYQFVKAFKFNFEPTLKHQINTYSNESANYRPFFIGFYSGISYNF